MVIGFESDDALSIASALALLFDFPTEVEGQCRGFVFAVQREPETTVLKGRRLVREFQKISFDDIGDEFLLVHSDGYSLSIKPSEESMYTFVIRIRFFQDDLVAADRFLAIMQHVSMENIILNDEATTLEGISHELNTDVCVIA